MKDPWTGISHRIGITTLGLTSLFLTACNNPPPVPPARFPVTEFTGKVIDRNWREHDWSNFDSCNLVLENSAGQRKTAHFDYPFADTECNGPQRPLVGDVVTIKSNGYTPPESDVWSVIDAKRIAEQLPLPKP